MPLAVAAALALPAEKALGDMLASSGALARERVQREDFEGAMRALASLRAQGAYLSRSLSYDGVAFASYDVEMSDEARACYDASVEVWKELCDVKDARRVKQLCKSYFNLFVVAAKVEWVVKTTHDAVAAGRSVVIGMSNTGDTVKLLGDGARPTFRTSASRS